MSRRMGGRAAAVVLTGIALAAVIAVFAPSVVASGTEKAGATIYGTKADCGATGGKANQGYSHNGRATFVRNGNTQHGPDLLYGLPAAGWKPNRQGARGLFLRLVTAVAAVAG